MRYLGGGIGHKGNTPRIIALPPAVHPADHTRSPNRRTGIAHKNLCPIYEAETDSTEGEEEDHDDGEEDDAADLRIIEEELDYGYQVAEDEADDQCEDPQEEGNRVADDEDEDGDLGLEEDGGDDLDDSLGEDGFAPL